LRAMKREFLVWKLLSSTNFFTKFDKDNILLYNVFKLIKALTGWVGIPKLFAG